MNFIPRLCLLALLALSGCATSSSRGSAEPMDYFTALSLVGRWGSVNRGGMAAFLSGRRTTTDEMGVTLTTTDGGTFRCLYKDTPNPSYSKMFLASPPTRVVLNCRGYEISVWDSASESDKLVRAWRTMAAGAPTESPEEAAAFSSLAEKFRAEPAAHVMPEETRALKVQAETAVREKRAWAAADRFRKALELSPWWAQGRFNLALIYAELNLPSMAIAQMDKYLKLAPDAPNARAAQDKIYEWRDKAAQ